MSAKLKLSIYEAVISLIIFGFLFLGYIQSDDVTYVIALAALAISGLGLYLSILRPHYLLKPKLNFETNVQFSPPTSQEMQQGAQNSWFLRLKISNNGLMPAKNCIGRLIEVRDHDERKSIGSIHLISTGLDKIH